MLYVTNTYRKTPRRLSVRFAQHQPAVEVSEVLLLPDCLILALTRNDNEGARKATCKLLCLVTIDPAL